MLRVDDRPIKAEKRPQVMFAPPLQSQVGQGEREKLPSLHSSGRGGKAQLQSLQEHPRAAVLAQAVTSLTKS